MELIATTSVFVLTLISGIVLATGWTVKRGRADALYQRLNPAPGDASGSFTKNQRVLPPKGSLFAFLYHSRIGQRLENNLRQADLYLSFSEVTLMMVLLFLCGEAVGNLIFESALFAFGTGGVLAVLPLAYIQFGKLRRLKAFNRQLPFALDLLKSSLEAGHSLARGLQVLVHEFEAPLASEFRSALDLTRIGMPLVRALEEMWKRIPDPDLSLMITAVNVQSQAGSSLAPILGRLSELVRARQRLRLRVKTLTAQARLSGFIIGLLPVAVLFAFHIIRPSYVDVLFHDPTGQKILKTAIGLDFIALVIINRILKVEY
jgi:tight adherence protein B